jgi:integrase
MGFSPKGERIMPKSNNRPPKYCKMNQYAVVYYNGKPRYLGLHGSPESHVAYARFVAELQANPILVPLGKEKSTTVRELSAAFLDYAKASLDPTEYRHFRVISLDFLDKLYGDNFPVEDFKPRCLKLIRDEMVTSRRFCRKIVNSYTRRIVSLFAWGVENDLVPETTWRALKTVKALRKGAPGTFDNAEREPVSDGIIRRTLPFLPLTLRAMVIVQRLTGMRPSEVFKMRVGEIIKNVAPELWHYIPGSHKTEEYIGKKVIPLGKPEQELIAPYLVGKAPDAAVFSPRTATAERNAERRANRKTKISPSQAARDKARAAKPSQCSEFYGVYSYRQAIDHAITKGNKVLPDGEKIPHWFPYQLRHSAGTEAEKTGGLDKAQALLGHKTASITKRYAHGQLKIAESMARNRQNPFEVGNEGAES